MQRSDKAVNEPRNSLLQTLDASIETFAQIRSTDTACVSTFDTLKEARAMIARALRNEHPADQPAGSYAVRLR